MSKRRIKHDLIKAFDFPEEIAYGDMRMIVNGNDLAYIENHTEVLTYTEELLRISVRGMILRLEGEGLVITRIGPEGILVRGKLLKIIYELER